MGRATEQRSHGATKRGRRARRGIALMDVIVGGIMLGVGLSVILSVTSRSLSRQTDGEKRMVASWLADELLNMVLVEGPVHYPQIYDTSGRFREPFEQYAFALDIEDLGLGMPFEVTATIAWPAGDPIDQIQVQTRIAARQDEDPELNPRAPAEEVDREARWFEDEEEAGGGR